MTSDETLKLIERECGELEPREDPRQKIIYDELVRRGCFRLMQLVFVVFIFLTVFDVINEDVLWYIFLYYVIHGLFFIARKSSERLTLDLAKSILADQIRAKMKKERDFKK